MHCRWKTCDDTKWSKSKLNSFYSHARFTGAIEVGYAYEAQEYSEKNHRLPPPGVDGTMGEKNYALVYQDILSILNVVKPDQTFNKGDPKRPSFFIGQTSLAIMESVLDQISNCTWRGTFDLFPFEVLFNRLKNAVERKNGGDAAMRITVTNLLLERGDFDCAPNIACQFHLDEQVPLQCTLSHLKRWFYVCCDHICTGIGIKLVAGIHLPSNAEVKAPPPSSPLRPYDSWDD